ncbi:hypothetical protein [Coleofasciculus sp. E2-BRE-01]
MKSSVEQGCGVSGVGCRMSDVGCRMSDVGCLLEAKKPNTYHH